MGVSSGSDFGGAASPGQGECLAPIGGVADNQVTETVRVEVDQQCRVIFDHQIAAALTADIDNAVRGNAGPQIGQEQAANSLAANSDRRPGDEVGRAGGDAATLAHGDVAIRQVADLHRIAVCVQQGTGPVDRDRALRQTGGTADVAVIVANNDGRTDGLRRLGDVHRAAGADIHRTRPAVDRAADVNSVADDEAGPNQHGGASAAHIQDAGHSVAADDDTALDRRSSRRW